MNPFAKIGGIEDTPPKPEIAGYPLTGGTIDYVLILFLDSTDSQMVNHAHTQKVMQQLNSGYRLLFTSQSGRAKVYQRL